MKIRCARDISDLHTGFAVGYRFMVIAEEAKLLSGAKYAYERGERLLCYMQG